MIEQNWMMRRHALGNFHDLLVDVTQGPGDAAVAVRLEQQQVQPERELRPGDDGAVHARRRPRLQPARRPRAGARADRLRPTIGTTPGAGQLPLRPEPARRRGQDDLRPPRALELAGQLPALRQPSRRTRRSSSTSCGATSSARRSRPRQRARSSARTSTAASRPGRSSRRSSVTRCSTTGPRMVIPPVVFTAGLLRGSRQTITTDQLVVDRAADRPAAVRAAERRRLELRAVARHLALGGAPDRRQPRADELRARQVDVPVRRQ